ncbi:MAG: Lrp/AsnC family transcriptional regulator [Candidatus Helarchaeales archaeon]
MTRELIKLRDLKEIDKKILKNLIEDGHQSLSKIAEKIGTTRQNVSLRIKKLQKKGIIESFSITLNNSIIEELQVKAYILFREEPDAKIRSHHEKEIMKMPQIVSFSRLFGKYDAIIEILARDNDEITEILKKLHELAGIKETETFIIHTTVKNDKSSAILHLLENK